MNYTENNKLIAEFMGYHVATTQDEFDRLTDAEGDANTVYLFTENDLPYHKSWDWLMRVIHKINDVDHPTNGYKWFSFVILPQEVSCQAGMFGNIDVSSSGGDKIEDAYKVAVETIKWYNKNK